MGAGRWADPSGAAPSVPSDVTTWPYGLGNGASTDASDMTVLERVRVSRWVESTDQDLDSARASTGEQLAWGLAIPWMFQALASPSMPHLMPRVPQPGDPISASTTYWGPLLHLLIYSFGWSRPDLGLRWWYDADKPTNDDRLRLLADVWDADGQLDWFAAWLWTSPPFVAHFIAEGTATTEAGRAAPDTSWVDEQRRNAEVWGGHSPLVGGSDPLHLSYHWQGPLESPTKTARLLRTGRTDRSAVVLVDSMIGWYSALVDASRDLPALDERSWRVDVVARPVGWLGTYRLSRVTGRWFSGRHHLHLAGSETVHAK